MFITHERLETLKAQQEHLLGMYAHTVASHINRLGKMGIPNDQLKDQATAEADADFEIAGLIATTTRIRLEISFIEDQLLN